MIVEGRITASRSQNVLLKVLARVAGPDGVFNTRRRVHHCTLNIARVVAVPQRTSIGHSPTVVLPPTVHVQVTAPDASAVFAVSPAAELGPLAYVTVIEQLALGIVLTST
jgi:hypothetical protein